MKRISTVLALLTIFAGLKVQAFALNANPTPVALGTAGNYAILAETGISTVVGSAAASSIVGDMGVDTGSYATITGFTLNPTVPDSFTVFSTSALVTGKIYAFDYIEPTPTQLNAAIGNMGTAYTKANLQVPGDIVTNDQGGNINVATTYYRGVYHWTTALNINANVTLSGSDTDIFIFQVDQTMTLATTIQVTMADGALASNVFWVVAGSTTSLMTSSVLNGNILCKTIIDMEDSAVLHGRALAQTAVTLKGSNTIDPPAVVVGSPTDTPTFSPTESSTPSATKTITGSPTNSATPTVTPSVTVTRTSTSTPTATTISTPTNGVNLGTAGYYGVLASTFGLGGGITTIAGDAGYTTLAGPGTHTVTGTNRQPPPAQAGADQATALLSLNGQACTFSFSTAIDLASDATHGTLGVYTPGVYCVAGAMSIGAGGITLNGKGTYVFRSTGAFDTTIGSSVSLTGGADACDVFWVPGAATTLADHTVFKGTIIDNAGITVGTITTWQGRALAFGGTVQMDADTISALSCDAVAAGVYTGPNPPASDKSFVFPSPARGDTINLVYTMRESGKAEIRIYNENGDLVTRTEETRSAGPQRTKITISSFAPGIYLYKIILSYDSGSSDKMAVNKFAVIK